MRKLILTEWITLDGYTSGLNNDMSFVAESFNDEMGKYEYDIVQTADTLVFGRVTYESFAGAWPGRETAPNTEEGERMYAKILNNMKKIVFSKTLKKVDWKNSELCNKIDPDMIKKLKKQKGKDMLIYGSANIVQQLSDLGLIDEYQLLVHPTVIGNGKALFKDVKKLNLKLVSSKPFSSGVILLTYHPKNN